MSRTRKGSKGLGYDYWSRRPGNTGCQGYGSDVKKITHSKERAQAARIVRSEMEILQTRVEMEWEDAVWGDLDEYDIYWDKLDSLLEKYPCR